MQWKKDTEKGSPFHPLVKTTHHKDNVIWGQAPTSSSEEAREERLTTHVQRGAGLRRKYGKSHMIKESSHISSVSKSSPFYKKNEHIRGMMPEIKRPLNSRSENHHQLDTRKGNSGLKRVSDNVKSTRRENKGSVGTNEKQHHVNKTVRVRGQLRGSTSTDLHKSRKKVNGIPATNVRQLGDQKTLTQPRVDEAREKDKVSPFQHMEQQSGKRTFPQPNVDMPRSKAKGFPPPRVTTSSNKTVSRHRNTEKSSGKKARFPPPKREKANEKDGTLSRPNVMKPNGKVRYVTRRQPVITSTASSPTKQVKPADRPKIKPSDAKSKTKPPFSNPRGHESTDKNDSIMDKKSPHLRPNYKQRIHKIVSKLDSETKHKSVRIKQNYKPREKQDAITPGSKRPQFIKEVSRFGVGGKKMHSNTQHVGIPRHPGKEMTVDKVTTIRSVSKVETETVGTKINKANKGIKKPNIDTTRRNKPPFRRMHKTLTTALPSANNKGNVGFKPVASTVVHNNKVKVTRPSVIKNKELKHTTTFPSQDKTTTRKAPRQRITNMNKSKIRPHNSSKVSTSKTVSISSVSKGASNRTQLQTPRVTYVVPKTKAETNKHSMAKSPYHKGIVTTTDRLNPVTKTTRSPTYSKITVGKPKIVGDKPKTVGHKSKIIVDKSKTIEDKSKTIEDNSKTIANNAKTMVHTSLIKEMKKEDSIHTNQSIFKRKKSGLNIPHTTVSNIDTKPTPKWGKGASQPNQKVTVRQNRKPDLSRINSKLSDSIFKGKKSPTRELNTKVPTLQRKLKPEETELKLKINLKKQSELRRIRVGLPDIKNVKIPVKTNIHSVRTTQIPFKRHTRKYGIMLKTMSDLIKEQAEASEKSWKLKTTKVPYFPKLQTSVPGIVSTTQRKEQSKHLHTTNSVVPKSILNNRHVIKDSRRKYKRKYFRKIKDSDKDVRSKQQKPLNTDISSIDTTTRQVKHAVVTETKTKRKNVYGKKRGGSKQTVNGVTSIHPPETTKILSAGIPAVTRIPILHDTTTNASSPRTTTERPLPWWKWTTAPKISTSVKYGQWTQFTRWWQRPKTTVRYAMMPSSSTLPHTHVYTRRTLPTRAMRHRLQTPTTTSATTRPHTHVYTRRQLRTRRPRRRFQTTTKHVSSTSPHTHVYTRRTMATMATRRHLQTTAKPTVSTLPHTNVYTRRHPQTTTKPTVSTLPHTNVYTKRPLPTKSYRGRQQTTTTKTVITSPHTHVYTKRPMSTTSYRGRQQTTTKQTVNTSPHTHVYTKRPMSTTSYRGRQQTTTTKNVNTSPHTHVYTKRPMSTTSYRGRQQTTTKQTVNTSPHTHVYTKRPMSTTSYRGRQQTTTKQTVGSSPHTRVHTRRTKSTQTASRRRHPRTTRGFPTSTKSHTHVYTRRTTALNPFQRRTRTTTTPVPQTTLSRNRMDKIKPKTIADISKMLNVKYTGKRQKGKDFARESVPPTTIVVSKTNKLKPTPKHIPRRLGRPGNGLRLTTLPTEVTLQKQPSKSPAGRSTTRPVQNVKKVANKPHHVKDLKSSHRKDINTQIKNGSKTKYAVKQKDGNAEHKTVTHDTVKQNHASPLGRKHTTTIEGSTKVNNIGDINVKPTKSINKMYLTKAPVFSFDTKIFHKLNKSIKKGSLTSAAASRSPESDNTKTFSPQISPNIWKPIRKKHNRTRLLWDYVKDKVSQSRNNTQSRWWTKTTVMSLHGVTESISPKRGPVFDLKALAAPFLKANLTNKYSTGSPTPALKGGVKNTTRGTSPENHTDSQVQKNSGKTKQRTQIHNLSTKAHIQPKFVTADYLTKQKSNVTPGMVTAPTRNGKQSKVRESQTTQSSVTPGYTLAGVKPGKVTSRPAKRPASKPVNRQTIAVGVTKREQNTKPLIRMWPTGKVNKDNISTKKLLPWNRWGTTTTKMSVNTHQDNSKKINDNFRNTNTRKLGVTKKRAGIVIKPSRIPVATSTLKWTTRPYDKKHSAKKNKKPVLSDDFKQNRNKVPSKRNENESKQKVTSSSGDSTFGYTTQKENHSGMNTNTPIPNNKVSKNYNDKSHKTTTAGQNQNQNVKVTVQSTKNNITKPRPTGLPSGLTIKQKIMTTLSNLAQTTRSKLTLKLLNKTTTLKPSTQKRTSPAVTRHLKKTKSTHTHKLVTKGIVTATTKKTVKSNVVTSKPSQKQKLAPPKLPNAPLGKDKYALDKKIKNNEKPSRTVKKSQNVKPGLKSKPRSNIRNFDLKHLLNFNLGIDHKNVKESMPKHRTTKAAGKNPKPATKPVEKTTPPLKQKSKPEAKRPVKGRIPKQSSRPPPFILSEGSIRGPGVVVPDEGLFVPRFILPDIRHSINRTFSGGGVAMAVPPGSEARHTGLQIKRLNIKAVFNRYWPAILGLTIGTVFLVAAILTSVACRAQR